MKTHLVIKEWANGKGWLCGTPLGKNNFVVFSASPLKDGARVHNTEEKANKVDCERCKRFSFKSWIF